MSFLNQRDVSQKVSEPQLSQRGRAGLELLGSVQSYSSSVVRSQARADFETDPDGNAMSEASNWDRQNEPWDERINKAREIARRSPNFRLERFLQRYVAEEIF